MRTSFCVSGRPGRAVVVTDRITGDTMGVRAVGGLRRFPPGVAGRIVAYMRTTRPPPPRMRLEPLPPPNCDICGHPTDHAPGCFVPARTAHSGTGR